jgi:hypothetical protein
MLGPCVFEESLPERLFLERSMQMTYPGRVVKINIQINGGWGA